MFYWFEPVLYLDLVSKFPQTTESSGSFIGFTDDLGDALTFKILKNDLVTVLHRSVVRSASDANHRNRRVSSFKSDVQESLKLLDTKLIFVWKDSHHKHRSRRTIMMCQTELGLRQITQARILAVELGLSCTT
jgi:hypothetical protein